MGTRTRSKKKNYFELNPIERRYVIITPHLSPVGFFLSANFSQDIAKCFRGENLIGLVGHISSGPSENKKIAERCFNDNQKKQIKSVSSFNLSSRERWENFSKIAVKFSEKSKKGKVYFSQLKNRIAYLDDNLLTRLYGIVVYLNLKNHGRAEKYIIDLLKKSPLADIYRSTGNSFVDQLFKGEIISLLLFIENNIQDKILFKMLISYVLDYLKFGNIEIVKSIKDNFSSKWNLGELRNMMNSPTYGYNYPLFWYKQLTGVIHENELIIFLENSLDTDKLMRDFPEYAEMFENYFPKSLKIREIIIKKTLELLNSKNRENQEIGLRVLNNQAIRDKVYESKGASFPPIFRLKRDFYKGNLEKGVAIEYSIYNLILLGDLNEKYFSYMDGKWNSKKL